MLFDKYLWELLSALNNQCTIISQIVTQLHVSTLTCHTHTPYNQYLARLHQYFYYDQPIQNYLTNYHTATCFDNIMLPSQSIPYPVTPVPQTQLSAIQFTIKLFHTQFMPVLTLQSLEYQHYKIFKTLKLSYYNKMV
jgi:hypothetical protein